MLQNETTMTGYARAAVDARLRMTEVASTSYMHAMWTSLFSYFDQNPGGFENGMSVKTLKRLMIERGIEHTNHVWQGGVVYIVAPAMTAVIAAAAESLDMHDLVIEYEDVPDDTGIIFFPEPVYLRDIRGQLINVSVVTWEITVQPNGRLAVEAAAWSDIHDIYDRDVGQIRNIFDRNPRIKAEVGPYVLGHYERATLGRDENDVPYATEEIMPIVPIGQWAADPEGRYIIDMSHTAGAAIIIPMIYSFWHLQSHKIAATARPATPRSTRRRAERAKVSSDVRVITLRRTESTPEHGDEARWHYHVRFVVRGHWRRLKRPDGTTYRTWVHAHVKGPDGAPLLHGEKIFVLLDK